MKQSIVITRNYWGFGCSHLRGGVGGMENRGLPIGSDADTYVDGLLIVSLSVAPITVFKNVACEELTFTIKFDDNTFIVLIFNIAFN